MSKIEKLTMIEIDIVGLDWLDKIVAGTIQAVDLTGGRYLKLIATLSCSLPT